MLRSLQFTDSCIYEEDCKILASAHNMGIPNIVELAFLARTVDYQCHFGIYGQLIGLDDLVRYFLHYTLEGKEGSHALQTSASSFIDLTGYQITGMSYIH